MGPPFGKQQRVPMSGRALNWAITGIALSVNSHSIQAKKVLKTSLLTAASCQGFLLLGYDQGFMSGLVCHPLYQGSIGIKLMARDWNQRSGWDLKELKVGLQGLR